MYINFSPRSSVVSLMEDLKLRIKLSMEEYGFDCEFSAEYPGWSYKEESAVREVFKDSYRDLFKEELKIEAIHAGLECGLFSDASLELMQLRLDRPFRAAIRRMSVCRWIL